MSWVFGTIYPASGAKNGTICATGVNSFEHISLPNWWGECKSLVALNTGNRVLLVRFQRTK